MCGVVELGEWNQGRTGEEKFVRDLLAHGAGGYMDTTHVTSKARVTIETGVIEPSISFNHALLYEWYRPVSHTDFVVMRVSNELAVRVFATGYTDSIQVHVMGMRYVLFHGKITIEV